MGPRRERRGWPTTHVTNRKPPKIASMGPRRERRGWLEDGRRMQKADAASMGPRRERRGWHRREVGDEDVAEFASMGPRRERRGWRSSCGLGTPTTICFNGAAAGTPRMGADRAASRLRAEAASMGPRRERRGWERPRAPRRARAVPLQWGRGGNAADGAKNLATAAVQTQGFNGAAAGTPRMVRLMQPPNLPPPLASMGPRRERRGWTDADGPPVSDQWLQWGRGGNAADGGRVERLRAFTYDASMGPRRERRGWHAATSA